MGKLITHHIRNKLKISRIIKQAESTTDCLVSISNHPDGVNCGKAIASVMRKYVEVKDLALIKNQVTCYNTQTGGK